MVLDRPYPTFRTCHPSSELVSMGEKMGHVAMTTRVFDRVYGAIPRYVRKVPGVDET